MEQDEQTIIGITTNNGTNPIVGYTDGDLIIIDNVKDLAKIEPTRPLYNFIILCTKGRIQLDINGGRLLLEANEVLFSSPHVVLDNFMFSPDFECKIMCLSNRIIQELLQRHIETWNRAVYIQRKHIVKLAQKDVEQYALYHALLHNLLHSDATFYGKEQMQSLIRSMLYSFCSILNDSLGQPDSNNTTQGKLLFDRFLSMIAAQEIKRQPVRFYASQLAVTPKYLTMVCQQNSEKSASGWINQYVVEDVRYAICNTSSSIKEIAHRLGFANMSHFGCYVRRHFGKSPTKLRLSERRSARHFDL